MFILQADRDALWQTVFHLSMHVIPRCKKDQLVQPWKSIG
jgi:diadenosine tetraphosphate (Ap4A) HIT family hydrolase